MKSEWRVTSNIIADEKMYQVYRIIDIEEVDHSGNRETHGGWTTDLEETKKIADKLNKAGE